MSEVLVQYWQVPLTTEKCDFRFNIKISAYFGTCTPLREGEQQYQSSRCGWDGIQVPETLWLMSSFLGGGFNVFVVCFQRKVQRFVRLVLLSLFFFFFSFFEEEARLQVPIARHPCSVISISYDQKKKDEKKDHSTEWHFSYTRTQKVWDVGKESGITYYSCYLVHLGLHLQVRRFVTA